MYTKYIYNNTQTAANLLADLILLLTGTTDVNALSAGCDKASSQIFATVGAGWSVYDASAGTNAQCLRAVLADDATKYKYIVIDTNTTNKVLIKVYESWNSGNHTGTNLCYYSDSVTFCQQVALSSGGRIDISASVRHVLMFSYQSAVYGDSGYHAPCGCMERTRLSPWDTVANAYPPFAWFQLGVLTQYAGGAYAYHPRRVAANLSDVTGASAGAFLITPYGANVNAVYVVTPSATVPDVNKAASHQLIPFGCSHPTDGFLGGDVSAATKCYITTYNFGGVYDNIVVGSDTYVVWTSANYRIAVYQG